MASFSGPSLESAAQWSPAAKRRENTGIRRKRRPAKDFTISPVPGRITFKMLKMAPGPFALRQLFIHWEDDQLQS